MIVGHIGGGEAASYEIAKSLRFRASASAYLSRTFTSSATWTFSAWVKRGALSNISPLLGDAVKFLAADTLTVGSLTTTAVFRDASSHYHIHVSNGGLYINGVSFGSVTTFALTTPRLGSNGTNYFDGYMSEVVFVDGSSVSYTNFGQTDPVTGQWTPKKYTGTYGTNGFYLPFNDGTNLTNLCLDRSGNANNWTATNVSLTAGTTYDWMDDTPTNSFATLNPINQSGHTISEASLKTVWSVTAGGVRNTIATGSGKWYFEINLTSIANQTSVGIVRADTLLTTDLIAVGSNAVMYLALNGNKYINGTASAYGASFVSSDTISVAVDVGNNSVEFFKNGTSQGIISGLNLSGYQWYAAVANANNQAGQTITINFGQAALSSGASFYAGAGGWFKYAPPTGYKALCTKNLLEGSITTSGSFTGNAAADGPFVWLNGVPTAMTINGNAVTLGTHADKLANGFKVRSSSSLYNSAGSNTYSITSTGSKFKYANAQGNP